MEDFLESVEAVAPLTPSCSPSPPNPAAELLQGGGRPAGELGGGYGGGRALSFRSWSGGGGGRGWGMAVAPGGAGAAGAGPWGVVAVPWGGGAVLVGPGGG